MEENYEKFSKAMDDNIPHEPGFYWGRVKNHKACTMIVHIEGEFPYLKYTAWDLWKDQVIKGSDPRVNSILISSKIEQIDEKDLDFFDKD